jgi:flagellum-specific ATP synthase
MPQLVDEETRGATYAVRDMLATYKDAEDLINIGAYKRGSNPKIDLAVERIDAVNGFLKQKAEETADMQATRSALFALLKNAA